MILRRIEFHSNFTYYFAYMYVQLYGEHCPHIHLYCIFHSNFGCIDVKNIFGFE